MQYYPPYGSTDPYFNYAAYQAAANEKRQIRRLSNQLSWVSLLCIFMMSFLAVGLEFLLKGLGYQFSAQWSSFNGIEPALFYIINGTAYIIGLALPVLLYFAIRRIPLSVGLPFSKVRPLTVAACAFMGSAVCLLSNIPANIIVNIEKLFGFSGNIPDLPLTNDLPVLLLYFLNIAIIPPIAEEMVFRGMLLQSLRRFGDGFAIVASALFFGLYHGNFAQTVFAIPAGLIMGWVAVKTNSLLPSILIHFLNNGISIALQLVQRFQGDTAANEANTVVTLALIALGALSLVYLTLREKSFFRPRAYASPLRFSSKLGALFSNAGAVFFCLYALVFSINTLVKY